MIYFLGFGLSTHAITDYKKHVKQRNGAECYEQLVKKNPNSFVGQNVWVMRLYPTSSF